MAFDMSEWRNQSLLVDVDSVTGLYTPNLAEPIVDGVLRRGHILMLTGPPKAGKSWCMAQLAYAIANGSEWMGFTCKQGTVCYIDTELDPPSLFNRFDRVRSEMGLKDSCGNIKALPMRGKPLTAESVASDIIDTYGDNMPSLVIIDSIYSLESGDENSAGDMGKMMGQLGRLASAGCAIAFAHHHAKGNAGARNVIDRGSGSGVFGRFVDAMVDLTPVVPSDEQRELLARDYGETATPMRMSFVLREFADPGQRDVIFSFPLLREIEGDYMSDAPEAGSPEAARQKGGDGYKRKCNERWGRLDEAIGRAVNQCFIDKVPPTRENVAERMSINGNPVTKEKMKRWTVSDAKTRWRAQKDGSSWVLYCTDEGWSS